MIKIKGKDQRPIYRGKRPAGRRTKKAAPKGKASAVDKIREKGKGRNGRAPLLIRVPFELLARLDAEVVRRGGQGKQAKVLSRNDVIVSLLDAGLKPKAVE